MVLTLPVIHRSRLLPPLLVLACLLAVGLLWFHEHNHARTLQVQAAPVAREEETLAQLQAKNRDLRFAIQHASARVAEQPIATPPAAPVVAPPPLWVKGEWTPASSWHNAGRSTPQATTTTLLWAAAHGNLAELANLFQFDDQARERARDWFNALTPDVRLQYGTPENLVAGATLARIAPERAQLSWLHEDNNDRAIVGMLVGQAARSTKPQLSTSEKPEVPPRTQPPALAEHSPYKVVVLSLRRFPDGWRVQVPAGAIDSLARRLREP